MFPIAGNITRDGQTERMTILSFIHLIHSSIRSKSDLGSLDQGGEEKSTDLREVRMENGEHSVITYEK